ncbi:MAG TPA: hypothetical protein VGK73_16185 [Polyangiaceae bacterium]
MKPLAPNCKHIGTCAEADAAVVEFAKRQGFPWASATHNDLPSEAPSSAQEPRVFSASAIELADDRVPERGGCRRAWAYRYVDKIRKPEMIWEQVLAWEEWAKVHGYWSNPPDSLGIAKPVAGQRSASCGTRVHLYAQWYLTGAATADADVYGPRRLIDWESLPGQVLQSMLPLLPPAGSVAPEQAEAEFELEVGGSECSACDGSGTDFCEGGPFDCGACGGAGSVGGVRFRGVIDLLLDEVWDHKTTRDIRGYALLPDAVADAIGAPERSLKNNLQSCMYVVRRARQTDPPADAVTCRWTYGETDRSRRALQVVQDIPYAHALGVVERAADLARTLTYASSDEAPPNTLACDKYGGCWYRGQPCKVRRDYGRIALLLEKEETEMAEKKMSFAELQKATQAANAGGAKPAAAVVVKPGKNAGGNPGVVAAKPTPEKPKFVPKKPAAPAPAPEPEPEVTEEEQVEEQETAHETAAQDGVDIVALATAVRDAEQSLSDAREALYSALSSGHDFTATP